MILFPWLIIYLKWIQDPVLANDMEVELLLPCNTHTQWSSPQRGHWAARESIRPSHNFLTYRYLL